MNKTLLKIIGIAGIVGGSVCLYLSGIGSDMVVAVVGAVFVLAGLVAGFFGVDTSTKK